jgi:hypothetical protein
MKKTQEDEAYDRILSSINFSKETTETDPLKVQDEEDRKSDRELKRSYGKKFFWVLAFQLLTMNMAFILVGCERLTFDRWTLEIYLSGTLLQVFGVVLVITKSLFPVEKPEKKA